MDALPYELMAHIATEVDQTTFCSMLVLNKDLSALLLSDFVLGKLLPKIFSKWSFVSKLIADPSRSALEKIKFQLQRRNIWFTPDSKAKLSLIHHLTLANSAVYVDGERLVIVKMTSDLHSILATFNLHTLQSATIEVNVKHDNNIIHKGNYCILGTTVVTLDKSNEPYDIVELSPTSLISYMNPNIVCDTLTASIGQTQCAVFDIRTKRALVKFEDNFRTILNPSSFIVEPVTNQKYSEFIIGDLLQKGNFAKSHNKIAFLAETTSWNKKQSLIVIEMDYTLQNVMNWHSVDLDLKFLPHTLYTTSRYVGLIAKRAVQVYDLMTGQMSIKRKFDTGPPVHTVRMTNNHLLLSSDYNLEIVDLDTNTATIFENQALRSIVSVTQDLVFLSTEDWPAVIDLTTKKVAIFGTNFFYNTPSIEKSIPRQLSTNSRDFVGANEQQLVFASNSTIQIFDIEKEPDEKAPFSRVILPHINSVIDYFKR